MTSEELALHLAHCDREDDVIEALVGQGHWDDDCAWQYNKGPREQLFGDWPRPVWMPPAIKTPLRDGKVGCPRVDCGRPETFDVDDPGCAPKGS